MRLISAPRNYLPFIFATKQNVNSFKNNCFNVWYWLWGYVYTFCVTILCLSRTLVFAQLSPESLLAVWNIRTQVKQPVDLPFHCSVAENMTNSAKSSCREGGARCLSDDLFTIARRSDASLSPLLSIEFVYNQISPFPPPLLFVFAMVCKVMFVFPFFKYVLFHFGLLYTCEKITRALKFHRRGLFIIFFF